MRTLLLVILLLALLGLFALTRNYNVMIHLGRDGLTFEAVKPPGSG